MGRNHQSFLNVMKILFVLCLLTSLSSCKLVVDTKLDKPSFTSFYVGEDDSLPPNEILPITQKKRSSIPSLLLFSRWEKTKLTDPDSFELRFALFDDKGSSYRFGTYNQMTLIKIDRKDSKSTSYYSVDLDLDYLLERTWLPMRLIESSKADLISSTIISGDIVPYVINSVLSFDISAEDNHKLKEVMKIEEWENINVPVDLRRNFEAMITLSNDRVVFFGKYENGDIAQVHSLDVGDNTVESYRVSIEIADSVLNTLGEIRSTFFDGPSQRVLNASFSSAYVWLQPSDGMYPLWKFPLSQTQNDTLKTFMKIGQWWKIDGEIESSEPWYCLYSESRDSYCYFESDTLGFIQVTSLDDPAIKETYYVGNEIGYTSEFLTTLFSFWENPVIPAEVKAFNFTKTRIIYDYGEDGVISAGEFRVNTSQMQKIKSLLRVDEWSLDKEIFAYGLGWSHTYEFKNVDGSVIRVYNFKNIRTVFNVESVIPNVGENGIWFSGPMEIFTILEKYMTTTFPKK